MNTTKHITYIPTNENTHTQSTHQPFVPTRKTTTSNHNATARHKLYYLFSNTAMMVMPKLVARTAHASEEDFANGGDHGPLRFHPNPAKPARQNLRSATVSWHRGSLSTP